MHIEAKYIIDRELINNADIVLFRGNDVIDKAIQLVDKAYYNHVGLVWKVDDRYLICDATAGRGVNIDFLSTRIRQETDFRILRIDKPESEKNEALSACLKLGDEHYGYNYAYILELALQKTIGLKLNISERHAFICSIFVKEFMKKLRIKENFVTPQDYVRIPCNFIKTIIE